MNKFVQIHVLIMKPWKKKLKIELLKIWKRFKLNIKGASVAQTRARQASE